MSEHFGFPIETILIYITVIAFSSGIDAWDYRRGHVMDGKSATLWSIFWLAMAGVFYVYLWFSFDKKFADLFLVGYVLEESLSIDNLMVFMAVFANFNIQGELQRRILFFGILGAIFFRLVFATVGTALFAMSAWVGFFFAAIVAWTAWKMLTAGEQDEGLIDYSQHWSVKLIERLVPVFPRLHLDHFFISSHVSEQRRVDDDEITFRPGAPHYATPAFLCLIAILFTDVMFSFDSVPAVVAVTMEPLLIYGAMIFAVLGLRSLYFVLAALMRYLVHLGKAVIVLLFYIAFKLALGAANELFHWPNIHISPTASLMIVLIILGGGVAASFLFPEKDKIVEEGVG